MTIAVGSQIQINPDKTILCGKTFKPIPHTEATGTVRKVNPEEWDELPGADEYIILMDYNKKEYVLHVNDFTVTD
jgi:hypothetical protein